jgi:hypothetical protein
MVTRIVTGKRGFMESKSEGGSDTGESGLLPARLFPERSSR